MRRNLNFEIIARAQVDARALLLKKSTGFCRRSVIASLLRLGPLLQDNLQMGAFSKHRFMFLLACID